MAKEENMAEEESLSEKKKDAHICGSCNTIIENNYYLAEDVKEFIRKFEDRCQCPSCIHLIEALAGSSLV